MPKEISHIYFADEIKKELKSEIQEILNQNLQIYYYGSTAPDLFYYYLPLKKQWNELGKIPWGLYIHDDKNNLNPIYELLEWEKNNLFPHLKNKIFSFVAGYLTHVAADTIFHPYIYSLTGHYYHSDPELQKKYQRNHRIFETLMDLFILENIYKTTIRKFSLLEKITISKENREILFLYGKSLKDTFFPEINDQSMGKFTELCYNYHIKLVYLFQKELLIKILSLFKNLHSEIENHLCLFYWNHLKKYNIHFYQFEPVPHPITEETIEGNFFEFTEKIKKRGIFFLESAYEYIINQKWDKSFLKEKIPPYSLNTGLIQISSENMQYFKLHPAFT
jgi:hypothetical protein